MRTPRMRYKYRLQSFLRSEIAFSKIKFKHPHLRPALITCSTVEGLAGKKIGRPFLWLSDTEYFIFPNFLPASRKCSVYLLQTSAVVYYKLDSARVSGDGGVRHAPSTINLAWRGAETSDNCVPMSKSVCVFSSYPFWTSSSLDVPAGVTQEEGHTGFLIHLPSAVRALIFVARRIQPFLSLVDREVEFCVLTN